MAGLWEHLDSFFDPSMDDRRMRMIADLIGDVPTHARVRGYMSRHGFTSNPLLMSYRYTGDEFDILDSHSREPVLLPLLRDFRPNIVFLDSGEFSSLAEFFIVDQQVALGTFVLIHDIVFPKSIKGMLAGAAMSSSPRWRVAWIDRSTPQGILLAEKVSG